jgi:uncharacterized protein
VIQGPPGAGKTYTTSHLAVSLIQAGKTVGIASNSHKAIDNVLHAIEERLIECSEPVRLLGQKKDSGDEGFAGCGFIESVTSNKDMDPTIPIVAGTAWALSNPELTISRDVLFVDKAGQVSLGNLVAIAAAAKSIVLVGDQMQLGQPIDARRIELSRSRRTSRGSTASLSSISCGIRQTVAPTGNSGY